MPWFSFPPWGEINDEFLSCMAKNGCMGRGELHFLSYNGIFLLNLII